MLKPILKEKGDLVQEGMEETQAWDLESRMGPSHRATAFDVLMIKDQG